MLTFDETETVRSVQLYGTDPVYVGKAAEILAAEHGVAHIDLNFGCPVPKVTRKGGGGALPVEAPAARRDPRGGGPGRGAVRRPGDDEDPQGHRRRAPDLPRRRPDRPGLRLRGHRAARPHRRPGLLRAGRLVRDRRARRARRHPGARQRRHLGGRRRDPRWSQQTGAAGVVVGRGCLGRPWLFRDLAAAFAGEQVATLPEPRRGRRDDAPARRAARATTWARSRAARSSASTSRGTSRASRPAASCATTWRWSRPWPRSTSCSSRLDPAEPFPVAALGTPRGRQGSPRRVVLPQGWLDDTDGTGCAVAEDMHSGGLTLRADRAATGAGMSCPGGTVGACVPR